MVCRRNVAVFVLIFCSIGFALSGCGGRRQPRHTVLGNIPAARRAAFDIGSGATKLRVADVILGSGESEVALEVTGGHETMKVDYEADLNSSASLTFSQSVQQQGLDALKALKEKAQQMGATEFVAVASGAFRTARNAREFATRIKTETGISVSIISADEEARLGYLAIQDDWERISRRLVFWDIGGAGASMTVVGTGGELEIYRSNLASVVLRDTVIRAMQGKDGSVKTPNPMSKQVIEETLNLVESEARKTVPAAVANMASADDAVVVGIGPVHFYSVARQVGTGNVYSRVDLEKTLEARGGLTDAEIDDEYADTEIVNLCLVLGYMRALDIDAVQTVNVNLADGLLEDGSYWKGSIR